MKHNNAHFVFWGAQQHWKEGWAKPHRWEQRRHPPTAAAGTFYTMSYLPKGGSRQWRKMQVCCKAKPNWFDGFTFRKERVTICPCAKWLEKHADSANTSVLFFWFVMVMDVDFCCYSCVWYNSKVWELNISKKNLLAENGGKRPKYILRDNFIAE